MRLLFFCLFACFLFNCGHPTVPRNIDVTRISKSDLQKVRSFDPTQLIDSCTYIPLETSDRILIGRVKQLKITDKYIFLVNSGKRFPLCFQPSGEISEYHRYPGQRPTGISFYSILLFSASGRHSDYFRFG